MEGTCIVGLFLFGRHDVLHESDLILGTKGCSAGRAKAHLDTGCPSALLCIPRQESAIHMAALVALQGDNRAVAVGTL